MPARLSAAVRAAMLVCMTVQVIFPEIALFLPNRTIE